MRRAWKQADETVYLFLHGELTVQDDAEVAGVICRGGESSAGHHSSFHGEVFPKMRTSVLSLRLLSFIQSVTFIIDLWKLALAVEGSFDSETMSRVPSA